MALFSTSSTVETVASGCDDKDVGGNKSPAEVEAELFAIALRLICLLELFTCPHDICRATFLEPCRDTSDSLAGSPAASLSVSMLRLELPLPVMDNEARRARRTKSLLCL